MADRWDALAAWWTIRRLLSELFLKKVWNKNLNFLKKLLQQILQDARTLSSRMNHRGACSCDNDTGDGAGVLTAIPHSLYSNILR